MQALRFCRSLCSLYHATLYKKVHMHKNAYSPNPCSRRVQCVYCLCFCVGVLCVLSHTSRHLKLDAKKGCSPYKTWLGAIVRRGETSPTPAV